MFRHIVLLTFDPTATETQRADVVAGLATLPAAIPEILDYVVSVDAGLAEGNASLGVVADFASRADYEVYRDHPAHRAVIEERILPILAARTALQGARPDASV